MDLKDTVLRALNELVKNGGEGSGDFGHAGNPPHVGGSEPVGSRHARGFISKTQIEKNKKTQFNYGKKVKDNETKKEGVIIGSVSRGINPDTNEKMYLYEIKWNNGEIERKHSSKISIDTKNEDIKVNPAEKIGVKQSDSKDKQSDSKEKKEDKKVATTKIIEGGIKETTDKYGRIVLSKKHSNKKVKIHKNGNYYLASYGQELKDNDGYTEFQVFPSASGKSFKTEKGAKKWALEKLKETANNSIYKHEYIEY